MKYKSSDMFRYFAFYTIFMIIFPGAAVAVEKRCGWLANPTPGNWFLFDRNGEWVLAIQGGYQADGLDKISDIPRSDWIKTNGNYGYGCACLIADTRADRIVLKIFSASPRNIGYCLRDKTIKRP
jgi:hypothetical protein